MPLDVPLEVPLDVPLYLAAVMLHGVLGALAWAVRDAASAWRQHKIQQMQQQRMRA